LTWRRGGGTFTRKGSYAPVMEENLSLKMDEKRKDTATCLERSRKMIKEQGSPGKEAGCLQLTFLEKKEKGNQDI